MKKIILSLFFIPLFLSATAQEFIPIWEKGKMPNSRGLNLPDSIANERIYQVGTPGLYLFETSQAENKGAAVVIVPGGGYARLAYQISGFQLAKWFNTMGFTAFVLQHRLPQSPDVETCYQAPLQDMQRALRYIRAHADRWGIDPQRIGVMGSSAGAHLSACAATITDDWSRAGDSLDTVSFRPDFAILVSPVVSMDEIAHKGSRKNLLGTYDTPAMRDKFSCDKQVSESTPKMFIVHAMDDPAVSCLNSLRLFEALKCHDIKGSSLHIFPNGGHSIALRNNPGSTDDWTRLAEEWLYETDLLH